jgi:hypothetical protein
MALKPTVPPAAPISVSSVRTGTAGNTTINADGRQPTVFDYSQNNQFQLNIPIFPLTQWFVVSCNVPGVTMGQGVVPTPLIDVPLMGDKLTYDQFNMTFLVDEKLKNYIELHDWLVNMAAPQNTAQFGARTSEYVIAPSQPTKFYVDGQVVTGSTSDRDLYCDIQLTILSSKNNPVAVITMQNAFPVSLSALDYTQQDTDTTYVQCNVSFAFMLYTITAV